MSSYRAGKPIFIGSIVIIIMAIIAPFAFFGYFILAIHIGIENIYKRMNLDYFEKAIIRTDNLVVIYNNLEYVNPGDEFKEYYSESHKTPLGEPSGSTDRHYLIVYVSDGDYTFRAVYESNAQEFELYCVADDYATYIESLKHSDDILGNFNLFSEYKTFPYNTPIHFDNLIEFLYNQNN